MYSFSDDDFAKVGTYLDNLKRFFAKRVQYKSSPSYESAFTEDKASVNPDLFYNWQLCDLALMVVYKDGKYRLRSFGFKFGVKSENEFVFSPQDYTVNYENTVEPQNNFKEFDSLDDCLRCFLDVSRIVFADFLMSKGIC
nr:hypothetical protein YJOPZNRJ_YJOPZNRJ_CDS_0005 [Microvirus sp.]